MYVGAEVPFRGVSVEIGTDANGTGSELTVRYWNGEVWVDASDTDNTESGGNTSFAVDGTVLWTVPAIWTKDTLANIGDTLPETARNYHTPLYWTRWEWVTALDSCDAINMLALNRSTAYAELLEGQTVEIGLQDRRVGCVQGITNAGTANLIVNVGAHAADEFEA